MNQPLLEKLDAIYCKLDRIEQLLDEILNRPRPTIVHLSAYSQVQIKRFLRLAHAVWQDIKREQR